MDGIIDFTMGLSDSVAWPWPIAVYLFLAGISGGALGAALALGKLRGKGAEDSPILKAASVLALATILLGMLCLVLDLTDPLFFWRILVYYNPTSVMSIGVMMLLGYIPLTLLVALVSWRRELSGCPCLAWLGGIGEALNRARPLLTWLAMILAFGICAYTGFLISALTRYPLINTAVLPALFVASGLSAGTAASRLLAPLAGAKVSDSDMVLLEKAEWPIMAAEAGCLFMVGVAMLFGYAGAQAAVSAFTTGTWAAVFWAGAVGVGFGIPLLCGLFSKGHSAGVFWLSGLASIAGMMCLRLFILYAGQLHTIMSAF